MDLVIHFDCRFVYEAIFEIYSFELRSNLLNLGYLISRSSYIRYLE